MTLGLVDSETEVEWGHRRHLPVNSVQPPVRYLASGIPSRLASSPLLNLGFPGGGLKMWDYTCCSMAALLLLSQDVEYLKVDSG